MNAFFSAVLARAGFVSAGQVGIHQHQSRKIFMELQQLEEKRDELNEEWGRLQLEQSTWATDDRIERIAITRLGMKDPGPDSTVLLVK